MAKRTKYVGLAGLLLTVLLAGVVSYYASGSPDGLDRVATDQGISNSEQDHASADSPLAGYSTKGVENKRLSGGLAGLTGVALTFVIVGGIAMAVRRRGGTRT